MRLFLFLAVWWMLAAGEAFAQALEVAPESREFCAELLTRIATLPRPLPVPGESLVREGRQLCEQGQVRPGIAKLRRAIRIAQPVAQ